MLVEASQELKQLVGTSGTLEKAFQNGDISLDDIDLYMKRYGGVLGILDGPDGSQRVYRGAMNVLGPDGQPSGSFTMQVYDPATMLQGPLTTGGGSGPDERVITFTQSDLVPLLRQVDRTARRMRGDGSRADLQLASSAMGSSNRANSTARSSRLAAGALDPQTSATPAVGAGATGGEGSQLPAGVAPMIPQLEGTMPDDALTDSMVRQQQAGLAMLDSGLNYRGTPVDADTLGALASLSRPSQSFRSDGTAYEAPGTLSAEQFGNLASGDDVRGTNLTQAGRVATAGGNLAQDANTRLTSRANNQQTTNATIAKANQTATAKNSKAMRDLSTEQRDRVDTIINRLPDIAKGVLAGQGIAEDNPLNDRFAQSFATAFSASLIANPKDYLKIADNEAEVRVLADAYTSLDRAIKKADDGDLSAGSDNIIYRTWNALWPVRGFNDLSNTDIGKQSSVDIALLAQRSNLSSRDFVVNVMQPIANIRGGKPITPKELQKAIVEMEAARVGAQAFGQQLNVADYLVDKLDGKK